MKNISLQNSEIFCKIILVQVKSAVRVTQCQTFLNLIFPNIIKEQKTFSKQAKPRFVYHNMKNIRLNFFYVDVSFVFTNIIFNYLV